MRIVVRLQLFDGQPRGFDRGRRDGLEKSIHDSLLDHHSADIETVHTAAVHTSLPQQSYPSA
jgi:hypothetical protein